MAKQQAVGMCDRLDWRRMDLLSTVHCVQLVDSWVGDLWVASRLDEECDGIGMAAKESRNECFQ